MSNEHMDENLVPRIELKDAISMEHRAHCEATLSALHDLPLAFSLSESNRNIYLHQLLRLSFLLLLKTQCKAQLIDRTLLVTYSKVQMKMQMLRS